MHFHLQYLDLKYWYYVTLCIYSISFELFSFFFFIKFHSLLQEISEKPTPKDTEAAEECIPTKTKVKFPESQKQRKTNMKKVSLLDKKNN